MIVTDFFGYSKEHAKDTLREPTIPPATSYPGCFLPRDYLSSVIDLEDGGSTCTTCTPYFLHSLTRCYTANLPENAVNHTESSNCSRTGDPHVQRIDGAFLQTVKDRLFRTYSLEDPFSLRHPSSSSHSHPPRSSLCELPSLCGPRCCDDTVANELLPSGPLAWRTMTSLRLPDSNAPVLISTPNDGPSRYQLVVPSLR